MSKLLLSSYGLTSKVGRDLIFKELKKDEDLGNKVIFLFHEPYFHIADILVNVCMEIGFKQENIFLVNSEDSVCHVREADYIYITEGNTFEILALLREYGLEEPIKEAVKTDATYIGASAGAMLAGVDIEEAYYMDRNHIMIKNLKALGLFDGIILPHYEPEERECYIANSPEITKKYNTILSVENDGLIVLEV